MLDYVCTVAVAQPIYFLWRPLLPDPKDDMVAEVAIASGAHSVVTHNIRDFARLAALGVEIITPRTFLSRIRRP